MVGFNHFQVVSAFINISKPGFSALGAFFVGQKLLEECNQLKCYPYISNPQQRASQLYLHEQQQVFLKVAMENVHKPQSNTLNLTLAKRRLNVSSRATLTFQLNRSPKIRMSGPVMLTTDGLRASAEVSFITSPKAFAASSFCSGLPVKTPSRSTTSMEVTPCHENRVRKLRS